MSIIISRSNTIAIVITLTIFASARIDHTTKRLVHFVKHCALQNLPPNCLKAPIRLARSHILLHSRRYDNTSSKQIILPKHPLQRDPTGATTNRCREENGGRGCTLEPRGCSLPLPASLSLPSSGHLGATAAAASADTMPTDTLGGAHALPRRLPSSTRRAAPRVPAGADGRPACRAPPSLFSGCLPYGCLSWSGFLGRLPSPLACSPILPWRSFLVSVGVFLRPDFASTMNVSPKV